MFDPHVCPRGHHGFVPVLVANQIRRTAVLGAGLHRRVLMHPDHLALEVEPVTYRCSHPLLQSLVFHYRVWSLTVVAPEGSRRHVLLGTEQRPGGGAPYSFARATLLSE
jgi:hypothetical protein